MNVITAYATLSKLIKTLTGVVTDFSYDSANEALKLTTTTGTYSIPTSQIIVSSVKGDPGQDGKSAYEIAVDHGYSGTEEDWIKNLGSSFDDSALQTAINKNKTDISNLSTDLINSQSIISQNTSKISKNTTDITTIKSDLADAVSDVATNKSDISNLKTNINKIGDLATLQTTDKTSIINAINELNSKFMQSMTYANKKLTITYKNGLTFDIDLSSIITDTNIGELSNVNDTGITDKQTLIFDAASNKYIPGTIDTSQTLKDAKDYTDKQIAAISHADAISCDEKPSLSGNTVTYKKGGTTETTTNLNTWFYYQDAEGNWQQTIFIDSVEVTIAMTGVDLTDYVSKSKDVVSTYTGTEVDKNKVVDIAALDALKALINTDLSKKVNTTDIVDALTSNATDKPLSANQGSVIKAELDKKANTTDMNTELAKKINTANIIDNLTSTDTDKPLSANQGKILKAELDKKSNTTNINTELAKKVNTTDIIDNLTSTDTNKPLSANQGKVLKAEVDKKINKTDIVNNLTSTDTNKPLSANQGKAISGELNKKVNITDIVDNLTSTDTNKPLSANQGKILDDRKLNKADVDKMKLTNVDNVNVKDFILENCTEENKIYYIIFRSNCTELPKNANYFVITQKIGSFTIKVIAKELAGNNNEYVCTYRSDDAKWSNWEKVLSSSDITTTIGNTSTDTQVPSAKAVFDNIKKNGLIWQGTQRLQDSQESSVFNYCKSNFTRERICGFRLEPKDGSGYFSSASVTIIYCLSSVNYGWILGLSDKSGTPMAIMQIIETRLKKWQKICSTSVVDVGLTKLEAGGDMTGGVQYYVKNGICYVNVIGLSSSTMSAGSQEIVSGLPVPAITTNVWYTLTSNSTTGGSLLIRIDDTGKMINHIGTNGASYYGSFSYPVAES